MHPGFLILAITAATLEVQFRSNGADKVKSELKGLDSALKSAGSGFERMYQQVSGFATQAMQGITRIADGIGKVGLAGIATIFTKGTIAAVKQVDAVEQATIALRAYEKDARKVDKVLEDLLAYARSDAGKLFLREELFHAAQALRVAGAETENLTRYVEIMSRSVSSGMGTWNELERVLSRVVSTGRLTTIEFELLQQMGFQLDESLRNTTVTAEELFDALDRGSVVIEGQTETLRGRLMTLQTAIRGVGTAFLGVDSETSQFIDGGLGSRMVQGIDLAIAALGRLQDAARMAGGFASTILDGVEGLVRGFQMLPSAVQNVTLGIVGAIAAFGMFRQAIAAITAAMRLMGLGAFTAMFSPLGLAITGVAIAGGLLIKSFLDQRQAAEEYRNSIQTLEDALEMLRRKGDTALADLGTNLMNQVNGVREQMRGFMNEMEDTFFNQKFEEQMGKAFDPENMFDMDRMARIRQQYADEFNSLVEDINVSQEEITALNLKMVEAINDPDINAEAWMTWAMGLLTGAENAEELRAAVDTLIDTPLSDWSTKATQDLDDLNAALDRTDQAWRDWQEGMGPFDVDPSPAVVSWEDFTKQVQDNIEAQQEAAEKLREEQEQMRQEWRQSAMEVAGFDNALSQLNMTGLTGEMGLFAEEVSRAGQAFDNTFRILVSNVQGLGSGIQQATDWMAGLVEVNEEGWAVIDQLAAEERISYEQRDAAANAYAQTLERNYDIQQNLLAIQAMQAPFIAEQVAATQAYVQELANMDAETQRIALAFMDLQTVQQAQEIITLGSSEAFRLMGAEGEAAFTQVIQGALQTNPLLFNVLETMGIISGTPMDFQVNFDAVQEAGSAIERLTEQVGYLVDTLREIYGLPPIAPEVDMSEVEAAASPGGPVDLLKAGFDALRDTYASPTIDVEGGDDTETTISNILTNLLDLDGTTSLVKVIAEFEDNSGLFGQAASAAGGALANLAGQTIQISASVTGGDDVEALRDLISDMPATTPASVDVVTTGLDDVTAAQEAIDALDDKTVTVDIVIGTNELDTGLAGWGLGTGGGGGAAGYTAPSVTIDVLADTSQAQEQIAGLMLAVNLTDVTTINVDADVSAAQTAIDGLGESDTPIKVMVDANVGQAQMRIMGLGAAENEFSQVTVMVDADTSAASEALLGLAAAAQIASGMAVDIPVSTPGSGDAIAQLQAVAGAATAADALSVSVPVATPGSGDAIAQLQGVAGAAAAADALSVNIPVMVTGAGAAINALLNVAQAAAGASRTVTVNVVTAYSTVGSPSGIGGGIGQLLAGGGYVRSNLQLVGEEGPELVQLPYGSYVHTAPETAAMLASRDERYEVGGTSRSTGQTSGGGGDTYRFFEGATFVGTDRDEMNRWAAEEFIPMFERAKQRRDLAKGMSA